MQRRRSIRRAFGGLFNADGEYFHKGLSRDLTKSILPGSYEFKVLAPSSADVPNHFNRQQVDHRTHAKLLSDVQMIRGLALKECAQTEEHLSPDGRHLQQIDAESWHVLLQHSSGRILGCARYRPMNGHQDQLGANQSALGRSQYFGPILKSAMSQLIANVQKRGKRYGEAGGWALRREARGSIAAVNIALMTFALAEQLGSGLAITTATRMNQSSSILCRIGARRLIGIPAYYEANYRSVLEVLHFDLPNANSRYASKLDRLRAQILHTPVICASGVGNC